MEKKRVETSVQNYAKEQHHNSASKSLRSTVEVTDAQEYRDEDEYEDLNDLDNEDDNVTEVGKKTKKCRGGISRHRARSMQ